MSSFFRSPDDYTDSEGETSLSSQDPGSLEQLDVAGSSDQDRNGLKIAPYHSARPLDHQTLMLHALLEDKCASDVLAEHNASASRHYSKDDHIIKAASKDRYIALCQRLVSHGLLAPGGDADEHRKTRRTVRDGLSLLSQQERQQPTSLNTKGQLIPSQLRQYIVDTPAHMDNAFRGLSIAGRPYFPPSSIHQQQDSTRYAQDFDEISVLGRGGYGIVYQVRHRIDAASYAVKKIPLSATTIQRIHDRGQSELDAVLLEVRTLARLSHPNIVRYHNCWIEWPTAPTQQSMFLQKRNLIEHSDAIAGAKDEALVQPYFSDESGGVVFEISGSTTTVSATDISQSSEPQSSALGAELVPVQTRTTQASVNDDDIETIVRNDDTLQSQDTATSTSNVEERDQATSVALVPTLHVQMSLYSMNLAQYMTADVEQGEDPLTFRHCFHLHNSIHLMLAIIDGVEYLHSERIIHRDLKPLNIFLATRMYAGRQPTGSIDPFACKGCHGPGTAEDKKVCLEVCIGDFGLASLVKPDPAVNGATTGDDAVDNASATDQSLSTQQASSRGTNIDQAKAVGTELYRPVSGACSQTAQPRLDIFSLGIVFFELLYKFGTQMERRDTLQKLRQLGEIPSDFATRLGHADGGDVTAIIRGMLLCGDETLDTFRSRLQRLLHDTL